MCSAVWLGLHLCVLTCMYLCMLSVPQVRLESDQAAMKQKEAEAASATQERHTLRNKLKLLQDQILRGDQATARQATMQKVSKHALAQPLAVRLCTQQSYARGRPLIPKLQRS